MTTISNSNIDWMNAKGWLKDGERQMLFKHASQLPGNAVILNIGVEYGASLACLRAGNATAPIIGLDLDITKAVDTYGCELRQVDSHEAVKNWDQPLDLIFVDGDHGELGVFLDAGFGDWLKVGCYLLFQDVFDWDKPGEIHGVCPGVMAGVNRWFAQPHIQAEFEEWPSVDTTRVFKRVRVKEHEQPTHSSGIDTNLPAARNIEPDGRATSEKSKVRRPGQTLNRG